MPRSFEIPGSSEAASAPKDAGGQRSNRGGWQAQAASAVFLGQEARSSNIGALITTYGSFKGVYKDYYKGRYKDLV